MDNAIDLLFETLNEQISFDLKTKIFKKLLKYTKLRQKEMFKEAIFGDEYTIDKLNMQLCLLIKSDIIQFKENKDMISMCECSSLLNTIKRRNEQLEDAKISCIEMLENINNQLMDLNIVISNFNFITFISKENLEAYINNIYTYQRNLKSYNFNITSSNSDMKKYFKINSELARLRSLYQILFGLDAMVKFFKTLIK